MKIVSAENGGVSIVVTQVIAESSAGRPTVSRIVIRSLSGACSLSHTTVLATNREKT